MRKIPPAIKKKERKRKSLRFRQGYNSKFEVMTAVLRARIVYGKWGEVEKGGETAVGGGGGTHPALERSKNTFFAIGYGPLFRAKMDTACRKKVEGNKMKFSRKKSEDFHMREKKGGHLAALCVTQKRRRV